MRAAHQPHITMESIEMAFTLPALPYAYDALEPHIDAQTMEIHHTKHHQTYINNLNAAVEGTEYAGWPVEKLVASVQQLPKNFALLLSIRAAATPTTRCSGSHGAQRWRQTEVCWPRPSTNSWVASTVSRNIHQSCADAFRQWLGWLSGPRRKTGRGKQR